MFLFLLGWWGAPAYPGWSINRQSSNRTEIKPRTYVLLELAKMNYLEMIFFKKIFLNFWYLFRCLATYRALTKSRRTKYKNEKYIDLVFGLLCAVYYIILYCSLWNTSFVIITKRTTRILGFSWTSVQLIIQVE